MHTARFIAAEQFGDASVLQLKAESIGAPGPDEVLVRQAAIGVNFIDILHRRGELSSSLPYRVGLEAAGEVIAAGANAASLQPGARVVYAGGATGAYADLRRVPWSRVVALPDELSFEDAAAIFFKGLTADYLVHRLRPLGPGDTVLFHAAAGGVGSLAIPLLRSLGVKVIGTVGSPTKRPIAEELGCDVVIVLGDDASGLANAVRAATNGAGVQVAYDSIGRATIGASLASLARFGLLVSFGWASGEADPIPLARLREQGSVFVTRPTVSHFIENPADFAAAAQRIFANLSRRIVRPRIFDALPLQAAAEAHRILEGRASFGSVILKGAP